MGSDNGNLHYSISRTRGRHFEERQQRDRINQAMDVKTVGVAAVLRKVGVASAHRKVGINQHSPPYSLCSSIWEDVLQVMESNVVQGKFCFRDRDVIDCWWVLLLEKNQHRLKENRWVLLLEKPERD